MWNQKITKLKNIIITSNWFFYQVKSSTNQQQTSKKLRPFWKHFFIFVLVFIIILSFSFLDYSTTNKFGINLFWKNIKNLFVFNNESSFLLGTDNNWLLSFKYLWITLKTTLIGTFLGFILAIISSFLSSKYVLNKYLAYFNNLFILLLRSFPELIFIKLFTLSFYPEMAMTMVFLWFSWLWLHKYFLDAINSIDPKFYFISLNNGNSKIYAFFQEIFLKLLSRFSSLFIYSFEANIRWGSILSALGLSGIGALIHFSGSADYTFDQIGIPLIILFIFIIFLEIISFLINKYLFEDQNIKITKFDYGTAVKVISLKKIIKNILFIVLIILSIVFLSTTNLSRTSLDKTHEFFLSTFSPDWSVFKFDNTLQNNPLLQILQSLYYALISLIVMLIFSFIIFYWSIFKLHGLKTSFTFKVFNTFIRLFPSVVFIYTFNPLANDPITLLVFVLGIHSSSSFSKRLYEITDTLDFEFIENLKIQSYSKFKIYIYYVIPTIKKDLITLSLFAFEMSFRSAITYAIFSANTLKIGSYINHYLNPIKYQPQKAMSYIWIATFSIFILNLLTDLIVKNLNNKKVRT